MDEGAYTYDSFGRRIFKTVDGVTTEFLYDGDQVIAEYDGTDNLTAKYIYGTGIDEPILMERGGATYYYHFDGLGSVTALSNDGGDLIESYEYDVYGNTTVKDASGNPIAKSAIDNPYAFTGRRLDFESGLFYYRARYYSTVIGRFLETDPLDYTDGINLYRYVDSVGKPLAGTDLNLYEYAHNNPVNFIDPYGLWYIDINIGIGTPWFIGGTGGILIGSEGIYPYIGGGAVTPGPSAAIMWSPYDPTTGWNIGVQVMPIVGGQYGYSLKLRERFWELGVGTPAASITGFYVGEPWKWPRKDDKKK